MSKNKNLGNQGEDFAAEWLEKKGYKIVGRNLHAQSGEIDILVYEKKKNFYIAFEVKTRSGHSYGSGLESITALKMVKIEKALIHYFLNTARLNRIPDYEIQVLILRPNLNRKWYQAAFFVEHYEDLS